MNELLNDEDCDKGIDEEKKGAVCGGELEATAPVGEILIVKVGNSAGGGEGVEGATNADGAMRPKFCGRLVDGPPEKAEKEESPDD